MFHCVYVESPFFVISGLAVMRIPEVKKGHEGLYKCVSQNLDNQIKYNTVEVRVQETGNTLC